MEARINCADDQVDCSTTEAQINCADDQMDEMKMEVPRSKRLCYRICVNTVKFMPVIFILSILAWSYYAYVYHLCLSRVTSLGIKVSYLIVYHVILILFLWSYFKTIFTEPADVPPEFGLSEEAFEEFDRDSIDLERQNAILRDFAENLPVSTYTKTNDIRFCDRCGIVKPDRCHHCRVCRKCVLKMDHHCPWISNCVSYSNYKHFLLFLAYGLLMCIYVVATTAEYLIKSWDLPADMQVRGGSYKNHIIFLFFIASMVSIILFLVLGYSIYLASKNRTFLESSRPPKFSEGFDKNGFNLGCRRNIQEVFGKKVLLWPFPVNTSLGDGVRYPLASVLISTDTVKESPNQSSV